MPGPLSSSTVTALPRSFVIIGTLAAAVVAVAGLRAVAWLVGPVALAIVIVILVHPVHGALRRRGVPAPLALGGLLVGIYGLLLALVGIVWISVAQLASLLPSYAAQARVQLEALTVWLSGFGIAREQIQALLLNLDPNRAAAALTALLRSGAQLGAAVIFLLSLLLFMAIESVGAVDRMAPLARTRPRLGASLVAFTVKTRRFLGVTTAFAVMVGIADTLLLWWLGVPLAPLWGLLAAVCNYIPYVGFVIGVVPPALLALLGGDLRSMIVLIVAYIVLNSIFTTLLPPYFVGTAVDLSITVTLISVVFWAWVLGPVGAILAVPLTLLTKAVLVDPDPRATWAVGLLEPAQRPPRPRRDRMATAEGEPS